MKDGLCYTEFTPDLRKRILAHNSGSVRSTKSRIPFELIYYESCLNMYDARKREKFLKSGKGKRYLAKRLKFFFLNLQQ